MVRYFVVASTGFDERFIVRLIVSSKLGVGFSDVLLLVMPSDGFDVRGLRVVSAVEEFISNYGLNILLSTLRVDVGSFWKASGMVRRVVEEMFHKHSPSELIVLLSGGMRVLILEVLTGCVAANLKGKVIVFREDLKGHVDFPLETFRIEKPSLEELKALKVISELKDKASLRVIAEKIHVSKTTAHRLVKELEKKGLAKVEYRGRASKIVLTEKAHLWL